MNAKVLCLVSGGIDSAVACYMMIKRGFEVAILHLSNWPYSDKKNITKVETLAKLLKEYYGKPLKLYVASHGGNQTEIMRNCDRHLTCVLCRRFMYRTAEQIAAKEECQAIVTGEAIGQVASQTLKNLRAISSAVEVPILRPLIGLDKEEIMNIARKIGTYDISTSPGLCCTAVPNKPSTAAKPERVAKEEEKLDVDGMIKRTLETVELRLIS
nr:7-cyano-7-deazaguanine synthase [Candidatus Njordarchaeum guaymaensis]